MTESVYKYQLDDLSYGTGNNAVITLQVPKGSSLLHVDGQHSNFMAWFQVDPQESDTEDRVLALVPTGGDVPSGARYLNTFLLQGGALVWHAYEIAEA